MKVVKKCDMLVGITLNNLDCKSECRMSLQTVVTPFCHCHGSRSEPWQSH